MLILEDRHADRVHTLAFSPDGQTLASVTGRSASIHLWNLQTREPATSLDGHTGRVVDLAFAPDGSRLASITSLGALWVRSLHPTTHLIHHHSWERVGCVHDCKVVCSPTGQELATTLTEASEAPLPRRGDQTIVHRLRFSDGKVRSLRTGHCRTVSCLAYSPDGSRLATGSFDRTVRVHASDREQSLYLVQGMKVHHIAFAPDGQTLASGSPGGLVKVWDATTGQKRMTLRGQSKPLFALCYSPDGRTIATAGGEGTIAFWDVATGRVKGGFDWGIGVVHSVAFAPDGMRAAAGGMGKIVVWDIDDWDG